MNNQKRALNPTQIKIMIVCLAFTAYLVTLLNKQVTLVLTPSIDPTLLWKIEGKPSRGEYATFNFQHDLIGPENLVVTKKITCAPGDNLSIREDVHFYCNELYLGEANLLDSEGEKSIPVSTWQGVIPENTYFFQGSHAASFDSRYFGLIQQDDVQRLTVLL